MDNTSMEQQSVDQLKMYPEAVICFGGEDWWYHNHGHIDFQLMRRYAKQCKVLYVNSIVMQKASLKRKSGFFKKLNRKVKSIFHGLRHVENGFWVYSVLSLPVHHLRWARPFNTWLINLQVRLTMWRLGIRNPLIWVACPAACDVALQLHGPAMAYQRTDRYEEYPNVDSEAISNYDRKLKQTANVTIYVNSDFYQEEKDQCRAAFYLDHGVDYELFSQAENDAWIPQDIKDIPRPIVGYFGALDEHKMDVDFLQEVIKQLPEYSFVFVGKASGGFLRLESLPNVRLLGQKPYEQIPYYGKCFDVAIIPWRNNRWTSAANPIKLKEYLALGKALVCTPVFTEFYEYQDVACQATVPQEFVLKIREAIEHDSDALKHKRRQKVQDSSWDKKAQSVLHNLKQSVSQ